jgi:hypothetical protein
MALPLRSGWRMPTSPSRHLFIGSQFDARDLSRSIFVLTTQGKGTCDNEASALSAGALLSQIIDSRRRSTIEAPANFTLPGLLHVALSQGAGSDATLIAI